MLGYDDLEVTLALVVGADQAASLPAWHRFDQICELATIAVVRRPDQVGEAQFDDAIAALRAEHGAEVAVVDMAPVPISSTLVRDVAAQGDRDGLRRLVPAAIVDDVLRLYGTR